MYLIISLSAKYSFCSDSIKADIPFVIWSGSNAVMTAQELASYCAPVFWFSSDEPELNNKWKEDIRIPTYFPFDRKCDSPVVYYQIADIFPRIESGRPVKANYGNIGASEIDISLVKAFNINYSHFYNNEAGLGGHKYDTEQAQFKFAVRRKNIKGSPPIYEIVLIQVTAKAHALEWYDNIWKVDTNSIETVLPVHILVEEGKHASCTDMNADGTYTPGYDVNVRINDAWGLRDVIRTGNLFTSGFESYLAKPRFDEYKVFPPLPHDSPLRKWYMKDSVYAKGNAVYELRPFPDPYKAKNKHLREDMESYYLIHSMNVANSNVFDWLKDDLFIKSVAVAARYDESFGLSVCFPLLIVKNVEMPLTGGWIVNRISLGDTNFRDINYSLLITPSASRFFDPYFAAGVELDISRKDSVSKLSKVYPVLETGIKFRANITYSFLKFLSFISPFWGVRMGIKNRGFPEINKLNYIFEVGAGVW